MFRTEHAVGMHRSVEYACFLFFACRRYATIYRSHTYGMRMVVAPLLSLM